MNKANQYLIVIVIHLAVVMAIGFLWIRSVKQQRICKSDKVVIHISRDQSDRVLLTEKEVQQWLLQFYKRDVRSIPAHALKPKQLEQFIGRHECIASAEVYLDALQNLHIDIKQKSPIVRVIDIEGNQFYLDENGDRIGVSPHYPVRVPVATGYLPAIRGIQLSARDRLYYKSLVALAKIISRDSFSNALVEQIDMDANGEFVLIPKIGSEKIYLGGVEMLQDKLDRLKLFYRENMGRQGWNVYEIINLKYKGQVIGKKSQAVMES